MKKSHYLILILVFMIVQCSPQGNKNKSNEIVAETIRSIEIEGLSLGMDFSKAREQVFELFEQSGLGSDIQTKIESNKAEIYTEKDFSIVSIEIQKNQEDKLSCIEFSSDATNLFLNATNLNADSFVKKFAEKYKLPEMNPAKDEIVGYTYWKYESKDGWYIKINDAKYLIIEKINPVIE